MMGDRRLKTTVLEYNSCQEILDLDVKILQIK